MVQSNGAAGQQDVPHLRVHLLPRWPGDGVVLPWPHAEKPRAALERLAVKLRSAL